MSHSKKSISLSSVYKLLEPGPVVLVSSDYKGKSNVMTMSWHMMIEFEPPLVGCVISDANYSFQIIKQTKECVINIPTRDLAKQVVQVGNSSGRDIDKFERYGLTKKSALKVQAPLIEECFANFECKVVDTKLVMKYNLFILEVVQAWKLSTRSRPKMIHHCGNGIFTVDGEQIKLASLKK